MRRLATILVGSVILVGLGQLASAESLQIQMGGLDLRYNGSNVVDAGITSPDPLTNATFLVNDALVGVKSTGVTLDLLIPGVLNIPVGGGPVNSATGGSLYLGLGGGEFLSLTLSSVTVNYLPLTSTMQFVFLGSGASMVGQQLPYGLSLADPISFSVSSQVMEPITQSGGFVSAFESAGTGEIKGVPGLGVPEPATLSLLVLGGLAVLRRRRVA